MLRQSLGHTWDESLNSTQAGEFSSDLLISGTQHLTVHKNKVVDGKTKTATVALTGCFLVVNVSATCRCVSLSDRSAYR